MHFLFSTVVSSLEGVAESLTCLGSCGCVFSLGSFLSLRKNTGVGPGGS